MRDKPVAIGPLLVDNTQGAVWWDGVPIHFSPMERSILHSLVKADGKVVTYDALEARMDSEAGRNGVFVRVAWIKKRFNRIGVENPIETVWGVGLKIRADALALRSHLPTPSDPVSHGGAN